MLVAFNVPDPDLQVSRMLDLNQGVNVVLARR